MNICVCITGIETFAIIYILIMFSSELYYLGESFAFINWWCPIMRLSLQNAGPSGCVFLGRVFKNAAQNGIKPRFLKTGLKGARPNRVLYAGP